MTEPARPTWDDLRTRAIVTVGLPRQLHVMHGQYGQTEGRTCGECVHCQRTDWEMATQVYKCLAYRISHSSATDWRRKWPACGKFEERG